MKNRKTQKQTTVNVSEQKQVEEQGKQQLIDLLLQGPEYKIQEKFSDKNLDKENEIIELLGGRSITLKEVRGVIAQCEQEYVPTFPALFYKEIDRLNNWNRPKEKRHEKPPIVGRWTKEIIYGRFPKEVLPVLEKLNPYVGFGVRLYKHFQWLTPEGKLKLEGFISDSISLMQTCNTWYEFRVKYAKRFGVAFQLSLLEANDEIF